MLANLLKLLWKPFLRSWKNRPELPVFLFKVGLGNRPVLEALGVQQIPLLVHVGPSRKEISISEEDRYPISQDTLTPDAIVNWINSRAHVKIYMPKPAHLVFGFPLAIVLLVLFILYVGYSLIFSLRSPNLWFTLAIGLYFFCQAGVIFNLIRRPPFVGVNSWNNQISYFASSSQYQYVIEGILIAFLNTGIGITTVALVLLPKVNGRWKQRGAFLVLFVVLAVLLYYLLQVFCIKNGFYPYCVNAHKLITTSSVYKEYPAAKQGYSFANQIISGIVSFCISFAMFFEPLFSRILDWCELQEGSVLAWLDRYF